MQFNSNRRKKSEIMRNSSDRIRSLSVELIDSSEDYQLETLVVERVVSDPHDEIISSKSDNKHKILIAYSENKRKMIQFELLCDDSDKKEISLWDLMTFLQIRCGHRSLIVAFEKCRLNILYAIEMEKGFLFYADDDSFTNKLTDTHDYRSDIFTKSIEEMSVDKHVSVPEISIEDKIGTRKKKFVEQDSIPEISIEDNISTGKKEFMKQLSFENTETTDDRKKSFNKKSVPKKQSSPPQKIAQFIVDGVVTYTFYMSDYCCLAKDKWLNDLIIDWYLMHLYKKVISISDQKKTFIYSSLFFAILRQELRKSSEINRVEQLIVDGRFSKVEQFTKQINIFEKDFVIIPVNRDESHWYLIIICFLGHVHQIPKDQIDNASQSMSSLSLTNDDDGDGNDNCKEKNPCILVFDSLRYSRTNDDILFLRKYLSYQYHRHYNEFADFSKSNIVCHFPNVLKQTNGSDCGIYVLQYVESFFKNPIKNFTLPIKSLQDWFPRESIRNKRAHLARLLRKMSRDTVGLSEPINFPKLKFYNYFTSDDE